MKNNKFIVAVMAAGVLLSACSKENGGDKAKDGEKTYMGFSVNIPATTRAEDPNASDKENIITEVGVFVLDNFTARFDYGYFTNFQLQGDGTTLKAQSAIETTTGTKTVYVIANPTTTIKNYITSNGATTFAANVLPWDETVFFTPNGIFNGTASTVTSVVMSGKSDNVVLATVQTEAAAVAALPATTVSIGRNVAKVAVKQHEATLTTNGGGTVTASTIQFAMVAKAKKVYMMEQAQPALYNYPSPVPPTYFTDNFSPRSGSFTYVDMNPYASYDPTTANAWYTNEHWASTFVEGNTTAARIKATFVPTKYYTAWDGVNSKPGTEVTGVANQTFYYNIKTAEYFNAAGYTAATTANTTGNYAAGNINWNGPYTNGTSYYTIRVQNANKDYEAKRNNFYELGIKSFTGPGSHTEAGGGDDIDPVGQVTYVTVDVTVTPWTMQVSGHDLQ